MLTRVSAAAVAALVLLVAPAAAHGSAANTATVTTTTTTCDEQLAALLRDVRAVPITSGKVDRERDGLVKLVGDATALVEVGKTGDAVVKLGNLQTKVDQLAAAQRISAESAALLTMDVEAAIGCISSM